MEEEVTYGEFESHTKDFLKQLMVKPSAAKLDDFLASRLKKKGISQSGFVKKLIDGHVVVKKSKVDDGLGKNGTGEPKYDISYKVPAKRFTHNLFKLHASLFEENLPEGVISEDGGGATSCAFDGSGQFIGPMNGGKDESAPVIRRRTVYMTEEQFNNLMNTLDEATATSNAGNYTYDVPLLVDEDDPTMKHNKGKKRGSAENAIGMDRMK